MEEDSFTKIGSHKNGSGKGFKLNYNPEANWKNVYARKFNKQLPVQKEQFSTNPFTKLMQPQEVPISKRFKKDNLNISDIPGT